MGETFKQWNQKVMVFANERPIETFAISCVASYFIGKALHKTFG